MTLIKGYIDDAGVDVVLSKPVVFKSHTTTIVDLGPIYTPSVNTMAYLVERTSSAKEGLFVHSCPIDANYCGSIHAIVYNSSNHTICYNTGSAFCQLVVVPIETVRDVPCKKQGKRFTSWAGSTDNV